MYQSLFVSLAVYVWWLACRSCVQLSESCSFWFFLGNRTCNTMVKCSHPNHFAIVFKLLKLYFVNIYSYFANFAAPISTVWICPWCHTIFLVIFLFLLLANYTRGIKKNTQVACHIWLTESKLTFCKRGYTWGVTFAIF